MSPSPPHSLQCREIRWLFPENRAKSPPCRTGTEKVHRVSVTPPHSACFLCSASEQSGFRVPNRRMKHDEKAIN
jgi:hypothetical protein